MSVYREGRYLLMKQASPAHSDFPFPDTGKGSPRASTMWAYPQPQLIGPSWHLSQAEPISSFPGLLPLQPKTAQAIPTWQHKLPDVYISETCEVIFSTFSVPGLQ